MGWYKEYLQDLADIQQEKETKEFTGWLIFYGILIGIFLCGFVFAFDFWQDSEYLKAIGCFFGCLVLMALTLLSSIKGGCLGILAFVAMIACAVWWVCKILLVSKYIGFWKDSDGAVIQIQKRDQEICCTIHSINGDFKVKLVDDKLCGTDTSYCFSFNDDSLYYESGKVSAVYARIDEDEYNKLYEQEIKNKKDAESSKVLKKTKQKKQKKQTKEKNKGDISEPFKSFSLNPLPGNISTAWFIQGKDAKKEVRGDETFCNYVGRVSLKENSEGVCQDITIWHVMRVYGSYVEKNGEKIKVNGAICEYDIKQPGGGVHLTATHRHSCPDILASVAGGGKPVFVGEWMLKPNEDPGKYYKKGFVEVPMDFDINPKFVKFMGKKYESQLDYWQDQFRKWDAEK